MAIPIRLETSLSPEQFKISQTASSAGALRLEPNQILTGRVVKGGEAGATRMLWAGHAFDLTLPTALPVGSQIQMKVLSTEGAIQLQYIAQGSAASLAAQMTGQGASDPTLQLSSTSRWVSGLMEALSVGGLTTATGEESAANSSLTLSALEPLRQQESQPSILGLAQQLQATIEKSGLFYEAHQAQWVQGRKTIESLLDEPQAQFKNDSSINASNQAGLSPRYTQGIPAALIPHIERQLGVLEQQSIHWQGHIWPNVDMSWSLMPMDAESLEDETLQRQAKEDPEQRPCYTRFQVNLPELGAVRVHFQVYQNTVNWHIEAENPTTQDRLKTSQAQWLDALKAQGINASGEISAWDSSDE